MFSASTENFLKMYKTRLLRTDLRSDIFFIKLVTIYRFLGRYTPTPTPIRVKFGITLRNHCFFAAETVAFS